MDEEIDDTREGWKAAFESVTACLVEAEATIAGRMRLLGIAQEKYCLHTCPVGGHEDLCQSMRAVLSEREGLPIHTPREDTENDRAWATYAGLRKPITPDHKSCLAAISALRKALSHASAILIPLSKADDGEDAFYLKAKAAYWWAENKRFLGNTGEEE